MRDQVEFLLDEGQMPQAWYNKEKLPAVTKPARVVPAAPISRST